MHTRLFAGFTSMLAALAIGGFAHAGDGVNWPQFRGPAASGISEGQPAPTSWNAESDEHILWKTDLPGLGLSSPIIWGDRIFVTTAVRAKGDQKLKVGLYGNIESVKDESAYEWQIICLNKTTGKILWQKTACTGIPKIKRHTKASHANSTPATDGKRVVAFFGSEGLYCYDMDGKQLWSRDLGLLDSGYYEVPEAQWGFGSSPVLHEGKVIVQCDVQKHSFLAALDADTGEDAWMTQRKEVPTWSTPTVHNGQVICNGYKQIAGYDLATGEEVWTLRGGGDIPVPTPIVAHDLIFITNAHGSDAPVYAIKPTAKGKLKIKRAEESAEGIAYRLAGRGNYMQTPIVVGDYLYCCRDNGIVSCFEAKTGKQAYQQRLGKGLSGFTASAICSDGKLYFTSEDGDVYVVQAGPQFKQLAKNTMGDVCMATPAISDGVLYFRTQKRLIAVGNQDQKADVGSMARRSQSEVRPNKPSATEEAELIRIAVEHLKVKGTAGVNYESRVVERNGNWSVNIIRLPRTPGAFTIIIIDKNHRVLEVLPGK